MGLETYHRKRDFTRTPEPKGKISKADRRRFVVQEHHASMLHFDFRLEMEGVLKSWSIRRGPSLDPREKRLAVVTEDHPVEYLEFEGRIPEGNYGAGDHMIWDAGTYELTVGDDPVKQLESGRLSFRLHGAKLGGEFHLVKMGGRDNQWLLIKASDEHAQSGWEIELRQPVPDAERGGARIPRAATKSARKPKEGVKKVAAKPTGENEKVVSAASFFKRKELRGDATVKVGGETVSLTNLDKVYWPEDGYTKGDLVRYYYEVSKFIMPYLKDRPLIMKRYPNGIEGSFFHQHDVNEAPAYVETASLESTEDGHVVDYIVGDNLPTLLYMANLGAIERHTWHSRTSDLEHPDWFVIDLDPGEGIAYSTICELALSVREVFGRLGLDSYAKTSGSRGLHVYVPIEAKYSYEQVADFVERVATMVAAENPATATVERALKNRKRGQIYVDHMQNARGKSVVAPYSVRPKPGATVSTPLDWREVEGKKIIPQDFTIKNILSRLAKRGDLFEPVLTNRQSLDGAFERAESVPRKTRARRAKS